MKLTKNQIQRLVSEVIERVLNESSREKEIVKTDQEDIDIEDLKNQIFQSGQDNSREDLTDAPELTSGPEMSRRGFMRATGIAAGALAIGSNVMKQRFGGQSVADLNNDLGAYLSVLKKESGLSDEQLSKSVANELFNLSSNSETKKLFKVLQASLKEIGSKLRGRNVTHVQMGEIIYGVLLPAMQSTVIYDIIPNIYDATQAFAFAQLFYIAPNMKNNVFLEWCCGLLAEGLESFGYHGNLLRLFKQLSNVDSGFQQEFLESLEREVKETNKRIQDIQELVDAIESSGLKKAGIAKEKKEVSVWMQDYLKFRKYNTRKSYIGNVITKSGQKYNVFLDVSGKDSRFNYVHFSDPDSEDIRRSVKHIMRMDDFLQDFSRQKAMQKSTVSQVLSAIKTGDPYALEDFSLDIDSMLYEMETYTDHAGHREMKNRGSHSFHISNEELDALGETIEYRFSFHFWRNGDNLEEIIKSVK